MILLTTPHDVGALDAQDYTHVRITQISVDTIRPRFRLWYQAGYLSGGDFKPGITPITHHAVPDDLVAGLMGEVSQDGETAYDATARVLYQHLIDHGLVSGVIA